MASPTGAPSSFSSHAASMIRSCMGEKNWDLQPDWTPQMLVFVLFGGWGGGGTGSLWEYDDKRRCIRPCTIV
jgi:hypothetical protein